ncbi:MAG TPA: AIR synthase-related protein, partial [Dehalococcoidia bacterium]|nr:AIR synthase-related protein [Dehalococcoidia bacterium]
LVSPGSILTGEGIAEGDVIIGLASSGIHSNGLTLARKTLLQDGGHRTDEHVAELGRTVGDELLEPTRIYVRAVMPMLRERLPIKALCHLTSEGYLNLARVNSSVGFVIDFAAGPTANFRHDPEGGRRRDGGDVPRLQYGRWLQRNRVAG